MKKILKCIGLNSMDDIFESDLCTSKHVLHMTYCPMSFCGNRGFSSKYNLPVVGDFVVYKYRSNSLQYMGNPRGRFAGMLNLDHIASLDNSISDLGGLGTMEEGVWDTLD